MADMSKAERLAAARKKLQDFQRKKEAPSIQSTIPVNIAAEPQKILEPTLTDHPKQETYCEPFNQITGTLINTSPPVLSLGTSTPGSYTSTELTEGYVKQVASNGFTYGGSASDGDSSSQLLSHTSDQTSDSQPAVSSSIFNANSFFNSSDIASSESFTVDHNLAQAYFSPSVDLSANSTAHLFSHGEDNTQNWSLNLSNNSTATSVSATNSVAAEILSNPLSHDNSCENKFSLGSQNYPHPFESLSSEAQKPDTIENNPTNAHEGRTAFVRNEPDVPLNGCSSSESIRQLSDQITHLIDPSIPEGGEQNSKIMSSLETRNQELAAQLADERRTNQQLQFSLKETQSQVSHLESKLLDLQTEQEVVLARHLGPLQEQLRAHSQTVGILVGEKTELEAAIAHHITTAKQHSSEVEELQNRLRASRHRVTELEKELSTVTSAAAAADQQKNSNAQELDQLRLQNGMLSKQLEDAEEEASELRQKLSARVTEVGTLTSQLQEKQSQLSLAQLRVTQLSASDNPEASAEIESLHQLKISLERRCTELVETVRQLTADRDQADHQYQQYVVQLNAQLQAANSKLETLGIENERLKSREEDLVQNMSELERQVQQQIHFQHQQLQNHQEIQQQVVQGFEDQSNLQEKVSILEEDRQRLQLSLDLKAEELTKLQLELEEREARIVDLETICNEQPDQSRLLAAMESDKVAAAQATSQNTVLKQQLQELQDGFIKMSNDKLHLTESLEHEKHVNKEMGEKISQLAEELHELRVLVSEKERHLQEYRDLELTHNHDHNTCNNDNHEHNHYHGEIIKSSLRSSHDHQRAQINTNLQEQPRQANDHIVNLSSENNNLRRLIAQKSTESHESGSSSSATEGATTDDAAADQDTNCEDTQDGLNKFGSMQYAMEKLQERFTRTMSEIAELTDEKQRLEHLVLQLQGETETIGEYVTLYQMQRAALQQRAREKDHQLATLSAEREDLRRKLQELNQLVQRLLEDRATETAKDALTSPQISNEDAVSKDVSDIIEFSTVTETPGQEAKNNKYVAKRLRKEIQSILEDISCIESETSFHPCPWCSGRLKNV